MASGQPVLSIIVCMHNVNPYMGKAFDSLTSAVAGLPVQTILVANGGYVPDAAVASRFDKHVVTRIGGLGYARNRGVEEAQAEYISFFDADDIIERSYVETLVRHAQQGLPYAFNATRNIGPEDQPIGPSLSARLTRMPNDALWYKHPFTGATLLIKRAEFIGVGGYKWGGYAEDYELSIRLRQRYGPAHYIAGNAYVYRLHGSAMSSSVRTKARGVLQIQLNALLGGAGLRYGAGALINMGRFCAAVLLRK